MNSTYIFILCTASVSWICHYWSAIINWLSLKWLICFRNYPQYTMICAGVEIIQHWCSTCVSRDTVSLCILFDVPLPCINFHTGNVLWIKSIMHCIYCSTTVTQVACEPRESCGTQLVNSIVWQLPHNLDI